MPQFRVEGSGDTYIRLVGFLFLALGLARLYGGLWSQERGAFSLSMWSWAVELTFTVNEIAKGKFALTENAAARVLAPAMLAWSVGLLQAVIRIVQHGLGQGSSLGHSVRGAI